MFCINVSSLIRWLMSHVEIFNAVLHHKYGETMQTQRIANLNTESTDANTSNFSQHCLAFTD